MGLPRLQTSLSAFIISRRYLAARQPAQHPRQRPSLPALTFGQLHVVTSCSEPEQLLLLIFISFQLRHPNVTGSRTKRPARWEARGGVSYKARVGLIKSASRKWDLIGTN